MCKKLKYVGGGTVRCRNPESWDTWYWMDVYDAAPLASIMIKDTTRYPLRLPVNQKEGTCMLQDRVKFGCARDLNITLGVSTCTRLEQ